MSDDCLSPGELAELRAAHRRARDAREAYRLNAVILLGQGRSVSDVADALLFDPETVRKYHKRYREGGVEQLLRMSDIGSEALLDQAQLVELQSHLRERLYSSVVAVARWVARRWDVRDTEGGMTAVLRRLGDVYKKAKWVPGKADAQAQEALVEKYQNLKKNSEEGDVMRFMDATHPLHNPVMGCGWIKRGQAHQIKSNTGRRRLNINGVIDIATLSAQIHIDDTIDAAATIALFQKVARAYPAAKRIRIVCDNARYYRSKAVSAYLETSPIELYFLPPYSPNLNLIERFWKFFKRQVLYNRYYEAFDEFKRACLAFSQTSPSMRRNCARC